MDLEVSGYSIRYRYIRHLSLQKARWSCNGERAILQPGVRNWWKVDELA